MKAIKTKLSEVKLNPNNPRLIKDDNFKKLVQSIKDFPEMLEIRPIVVNADMVILGGNMRFKACKEAGLKEVPIIVADNLTEEQQREFLIKDNVSGGEWDWSLLNEWDSEQLEDWGLEVPLDNEGNQKGKIKKENLTPFVKTHILISFSPEKMIDIQEHVSKICLIEGVEYEQSNN
jgi:hypothetical protein